MISKLEELRKKYTNFLYKIYCTYVKEIVAIEDIRKRKVLTMALLDWVDSKPVYGFNSATYNLDMIKQHIPRI